MLESCVGTGRNLEFYKFAPIEPQQQGEGRKEKATTRNATQQNNIPPSGLITSLTLTDTSPAMLALARRKWSYLHQPPPPTARNQKANLNSPFEPTFLPTNPPQGNFTTTIQSFGLCSLPSPTLHILNLASLTDPADGKILLLEHGRAERSYPPEPAPSISSNGSFSPDDGLPASTTAARPGVWGGMLGKMSLDPDSDDPSSSSSVNSSQQTAEDAAARTSEEAGGRMQRFVNWVLDRSARQHAERHGCWYNRSIAHVVKECEDAGVVVVEGWEGVWWYVSAIIYHLYSLVCLYSALRLLVGFVSFAIRFGFHSYLSCLLTWLAAPLTCPCPC